MRIFSDVTTVIALLFALAVIFALLFIVFRIFGAAARRNPNHPKNIEDQKDRDRRSGR